MTLCCKEIICASKTVLTGGWDQRKRERTIFLDFFFLWDARDTLHLSLLRKAALRMQDSVILFLNAVFSPLSLGGGGSFTKAQIRSCCRWEVSAGLLPSFDHVLLWQWDLKTPCPGLR